MPGRHPWADLVFGKVSLALATVVLATASAVGGDSRAWVWIIGSATFVTVHTAVNAGRDRGIVRRLGRDYDRVQRGGELAEVDSLVAWMVDAGYAQPELDVAVEDPVTGEEICVAEALWADGLQEGFGEAVILELELNDESDEKLAGLGFRAFPTPGSLREFVERLERERLGEALVG